MIKLVSYEDPRHSGDFTVRAACKLLYHHVRFFGPSSCHLERDGIEVDPVDDLGMAPGCMERAEAEYERLYKVDHLRDKNSQG